jgi:N-methylhydantoinase A/oxoprolinase/acetone carboxylase beta subunit
MSQRVGIDVGGTFTDAVRVDEATGELRVWKHRTTYEHLPDGVTASLRASLSDDATLSAIFHGTTLVSNAVVQRRGAQTGLIATEGFRDLLEIRRNMRQHLYDIQWDKPLSLVRRMLRREVRERIGPAGEVVLPLDEDSVREAVRFLRHKGVESYAVCLLFAFRNPVHEQRVRAIIEEEHPGADVSLSSDISPEIREYERTSTVTLNAMVRPLIRDYLAELAGELERLAIAGPLHIVKANGGAALAETVREKAIETYASGPAAGVTGAAALGRAIGLDNLITFDVGGTTTDVAIVAGGTPVTTLESDIEWGVPVRIPMTLVRSVGAGGGSIAHVDSGGVLHVGPRSAGSNPGPAAYGWGGTEPTVSDCNLVLGRLSDELLGGTLRLDAERARDVVREHVAEPMGSTVEEAAEAVLRIALNNTVNLIREMTIGEGRDPREFSLLAFGGNGPQYAAEAAAELGIENVVIPVNASVFSAVGCLFADIRHEYARTLLASAEPLDPRLPDAVRDAFAAMSVLAEADLARDGIAQPPALGFEFDLRYVGAAYELRIPQRAPVESGSLPSERDIVDAVEDFHDEHNRLYGFRREDPVELVNGRLVARVEMPKPPWPRGSGGGTTTRAQERDVFVDGRITSVPVYDRAGLGPTSTLPGPSLVEEAQAVTFIPGGWSGTVDEYGNLRLTHNVEEGR